MTFRYAADACVMSRRGNILLLMLGLITVMLVFSFSFLRSMQMSRSGSQLQRQQQLADLAAQMGLQHAVAVALHEYAMAKEVRDDPDGQVPAVSRIDSPSRNVFNILSPRVSTQVGGQQLPTPWDLAPDVPFQDLYSHFSGSYHIPPDYNGATFSNMILGYATGWSMRRGYARLFEANRFEYVRTADYDPSSYRFYDLTPLNSSPPVMPDPTVVSTPFPPVDPFVRGRPIKQYAGRALDHPLWLDADYRPVPMSQAVDDVTNVGSALARYRLRYAVCSLDQSPTLWINTDPDWLPTETRKATMRNAYKEALYAVGVQFGWQISHTGGYFTEYGTSLENIFLGYGSYQNSRFDGVSGIPLDWPSRGGAPMYYRSPAQGSGDWRMFGCVHGSPYMNWFDGGSWKGAPLTSWNDLSFAIQNYHDPWYVRGETGFNSTYNNQETLVRADHVAQRGATPFGRPYEAATDHPWQVNVLAIPMRILEAMVSAYVPPAVRGGVGVEKHTAYVYDKDSTDTKWKNGFWADTAGTSDGGSWIGPTSWNIYQPGTGVDLFTDAFRPGSTTPFAEYATPANRDYWISPATVRSNHDAQFEGDGERYPGAQFFCRTVETLAQLPTEWSDITSDPWQVKDSTDATATTFLANLLTTYGQPSGVDGLGKHIVFYDPNSNTSANPKINPPALGGTLGYLSSYWNASKVEKWAREFTPISPFACDRQSLHDSWATSIASGTGTQCFLLYPRGVMTGNYTPPDPVGVPDPMHSEYPPISSFTQNPLDIAPQDRDTINATLNTAGISKGGNNLNLAEAYKVTRTANLNELMAPNSYWNRVSVAFVHAVLVTQIANLAYYDPTDARNPNFRPSDSYTVPTAGKDKSNNAAGIIYNPTPNAMNRVDLDAMRKGTLTGKWDPKAADFASLKHLDRQFLANLGESFDTPGTVTASQARTVRPPRYSRLTTPASGINDQYSAASGGTFSYGSYLYVGEYHVTNNIRTLLTPCNGSLTAHSTDAQPAPPRKLWLLDEWNGGAEASYTPGSVVGTQPTKLARARAKLMERILNDWRMSFLGSAKSYADDFRPKDFDGDGLVFCSGYLDNPSVDPTSDTPLRCWQYADANGDGPGNASGGGTKKLTIFSITGCLAFTRSHQYKILVRGELYDNIIGRPVAEKYLETALLVDPDNNIVRSSNPAVLPTGLNDSTIIMQRPIHNYYRGYLSTTYP
jgi:hypothetical protein